MGLLFVYGFFITPSIKVSARHGRTVTDMDVTVTVPDVTGARMLEVYACAADQDDTGVFCTDSWDRASQQELRDDQRQYYFPWHGVPRGLIQVSAVMADSNGKSLASGQTRVFQ